MRTEPLPAPRGGEGRQLSPQSSLLITSCDRERGARGENQAIDGSRLASGVQGAEPPHSIEHLGSKGWGG